MRLIEARPYGSGKLPRAADFRAIYDIFHTAQVPLVIDSRGPADFGAFMEAIGASADIVHFDGHADKDEKGNTYLVLENRRYGTPEPVGLSDIFERINHRHGRNPVLLCLSSCRSLSEEETARADSCQGLAGIVAFQNDVRADDATALFRAFYSELARGSSLQMAFLEACRQQARDHLARTFSRGMNNRSPGPIAVLRMPGWQLVDQGQAWSTPVTVLQDPSSHLNSSELSPALPTLCRGASKLHESLLSPGRSSGCVAIVGPPDTGRTSLARTVARHVGWAFRSVTVVDLHAQPTHLSADALATLVLNSLDLRQRFNSESAVDAFLKEVSGVERQGVLVILLVRSRDSLYGEAWDLLRRVRAPSAFIIVAPPHMAAYGWRSISLRPIAPGEAQDYFLENLGAEGPYRSEAIAAVRELFDEVYRRIGGHPLQLKTVARSIRTGVDVRRLAHEGPSSTRHPRWLEGLLVSIDQHNGRALLRTLAAFVGPVPADVAASLTSTKPAEINHLVDLGLVQVEQPGSTLNVHETLYSVHPIVRKVILQVSPMTASETLQTILAAESACAGSDAWAEVCRASLLYWAGSLSRAGVDDLRVSGLVKDALRKIVAAGETRVSDLERRWQHGLASETLNQVAEVLALFGWQRKGDELKVRALRSLLRTGRLDQAEPFAERLRREEDWFPKGHGLGLLADIRRRQGRSNESRELYCSAAKCCPTEKEPVAAAAIRKGLADLDREAGNFGSAFENLTEASRILQRGRGSRELWMIAERRAYVHEILGHRKRAESLYRQVAAELSPGDADRVRAIIGIANVLCQHEDMAQAESEFAAALKLAKELNNPLLEAEVGARLARARARSQSPQRTRSAIAMVRELLDGGQVPMTYRRLQLEVELAESSAQVADLREATGYLDDVERLGFAAIAGPAGHATCLRARALVAESDGRRTASPDGLGRAAVLFREAAGAYETIGYNWRAARCRLHEVDCLIRAGEAVDLKLVEHAYTTALDLEAQFRVMDDVKRQAYALRHCARGAELLGYECSAYLYYAARLAHQEYMRRAEAEVDDDASE
ncbi:MAG: CHAT domain-containing protein [Polyangiaceae bacterium]|nr:CHAT domain-containing protein [Polyangiaceae bacterium]